MTTEEATIDALKSRVAELEGKLGEICNEIGGMYNEAETDLLRDTGSDYQFDCGRYDGLQDAITSIEIIAGPDAPLSGCEVVGHSWQPIRAELFDSDDDLEGTPAEVLRCSTCDYRCHAPVPLAQAREGA